MISVGKPYRLKGGETIAVSIDPEKKDAAIFIPLDSIIEVTEAVTDASCMVRVKWHGFVCDMFIGDLKARGEPLK
jgi:hypothetical protein